jgi:hypothetical protein
MHGKQAANVALGLRLLAKAAGKFTGGGPLVLAGEYAVRGRNGGIRIHAVRAAREWIASLPKEAASPADLAVERSEIKRVIQQLKRDITDEEKRAHWEGARALRRAMRLLDPNEEHHTGLHEPYDPRGG